MAKASGGTTRQQTVSLASIEKALGLTVNQAREVYRWLTPRQQDVAREMARGLSNRQIADELDISPKTLDIHRADVYQKLKVATMAGGARIVHLVELAEAAR